MDAPMGIDIGGPLRGSLLPVVEWKSSLETIGNRGDFYLLFFKFFSEVFFFGITCGYRGRILSDCRYL